MSDCAKEFGGALFSLAFEEQADERILGEFRLLTFAFGENPGYLRLLANPGIPKGERLACLNELLADRIHPYLKNFLLLLLERGYITSAPACFDEFSRLFDDAHGIARAKVESAVPLSEEQKSRLAARLEALTGCQVECAFSVTPALLGGLRVTVGGKQYEGSVRAKLNAIGESISSLTL